MHKIIEFVKQLNADKKASPIFKDIEKYLETGDKKILKKINTNGPWQYYSGMYTHAAKLKNLLEISEKETDEINSRFLDVLIKTNFDTDILRKYLGGEKNNENTFAVILESLKRCQYNMSDFVDRLCWNEIFLNSEKKPNSATRYLLSLSDKELTEILAFVDDYALDDFTKFLFEFAPQRVEAQLPWLVLHKPSRMKPGKNQEETFCTNATRIIFEKSGDKYAEKILDVWNQIEDETERLESGRMLAFTCPKTFREPVRAFVFEFLKQKKNRIDETITCFLVENFGLEYVDMICEFLEKPNIPSSYGSGYWGIETCQVAITALGEKAMPFLDSTLKNKEHYVRLRVLEQIIEFNNNKYDEKIADIFVREFATGKETVNFLLLAKKWKPERLVESLWGLLGCKSKPARETAARMLGDLGKIDFERVKKLLTEKKADCRESAVLILSKIADDQSIKLLESHVDEETNDDVRDKILYALEAAWESRGIKITMKTIQKRVERAAEKVKGFSCKWLDIRKLPPLVAEKKPLDEKTVRYLLYRQSRCKEMRADIEAKPLFAMIDRKTSGDFALAVLNAFLASPKQDATDRWALAIAGLLGDDRVVTPLSRQIATWADNARGKMSEYAVQSLALLGTEAALTVMSTLMIRYRSKYKNIGTAATVAFEGVAEQRGVTPDELGDRVVPWLGFEPGKTRIWDIGGKSFEVRVGMNFKVALFDVEKKKNVATLPKMASKEITEELKELKDALKEVVKGQLLRIENMLVRQYRWPVDRWNELYLQHPVLRPFTVRLVWGEYNAKGELLKTFRGLEDGTLTDADDNTVKLAKSSSVGIVHPLELQENERAQWQQHLADYNVASPFPQMERSVIVPKKEERELLATEQWNGTTLNAMTFKGRAEKLGWRRGSVCDGGGIISYWKTFPESGADAFLSLEGVFIGVSMDDEITLGELCFVKTGTTRVGSYTYDEPMTDKDKDTRIIPFGKVPPIVFSEIFGDMKKIAGDKT